MAVAGSGAAYTPPHTHAMAAMVTRIIERRPKLPRRCREGSLLYLRTHRSLSQFDLRVKTLGIVGKTDRAELLTQPRPVEFFQRFG